MKVPLRHRLGDSKRAGILEYIGCCFRIVTHDFAPPKTTCPRERGSRTTASPNPSRAKLAKCCNPLVINSRQSPDCALYGPPQTQSPPWPGPSVFFNERIPCVGPHAFGVKDSSRHRRAAGKAAEARPPPPPTEFAIAKKRGPPPFPRSVDFKRFARRLFCKTGRHLRFTGPERATRESRSLSSVKLERNTVM